MEETSEELPNFSIGIDLLGPDPTSSKNKAELKKLASCTFRKFVGRPAAANFGRKTFTGNRTNTNWSSTTLMGNISVFIVVFMHFWYLRTIRLKQENFSRNNNTNYTRRHKFITHKNNCCQVFSRSRNDQSLFVNEYKVKWQSSSLKWQFFLFRRAKHKHLFSRVKPILHDFLRTCEYF